jgi:hypothetical protein
MDPRNQGNFKRYFLKGKNRSIWMGEPHSILSTQMHQHKPQKCALVNEESPGSDGQVVCATLL